MIDEDVVQQKAQSVLDDYKVKEPFVDVYKIARDKGLTIVPMIPAKDGRIFSGFLDSNGKAPVIYVNASEPVPRQTWTVAHELGHYFLGHKPDKWGINWRDQNPEDKDEFEQAADFFAANLLIPKKLLEKTMEKYLLKREDTVLLAEMFGVSPAAMQRRLDFLGL